VAHIVVFMAIQRLVLDILFSGRGLDLKVAFAPFSCVFAHRTRMDDFFFRYANHFIMRNWLLRAADQSSGSVAGLKVVFSLIASGARFPGGWEGWPKRCGS